MRTLQIADRSSFMRMTTEELRDSFLLQNLFMPGEVNLVYLDLERTVVGAAVPTAGALPLPCPTELRADQFTNRRELGIFNIGGPGKVNVAEHVYPLGNKDALYVGRGAQAVSFVSDDPAQPAEFYLLSYPAHGEHATEAIHSGQVEPVALGAAETANVRRITKLIHADGIRSCQLVMGFTDLAEGSVWNTMPPHTHMRRSEIYLYFNLAEEHRVVHLMGPPDETRHLMVANKQVAISPPWSIHCGAGTGRYSFCWGMGGENQEYTDMDPAPVSGLR